MNDDRIELEEGSNLPIRHDDRPMLDEPPPVRLLSVEDVRLPAAPELESALDVLLVHVLKFVKVPADEFHLFYRSASFDLIYQTHNPPVKHEKLLPTLIEVPSLTAIERLLNEVEIRHERQRSLVPGEMHTVLQDAAGNWLALCEKNLLAT